MPLDTSSPRNGDVVVTRETQSRVHYTLRQLPGIVQFSADVRNEALRLARQFGQKHAVDVWYSEAGTYRLLEAHRSRTTTRTTVGRMDDAHLRGDRNQ